MGRVMKLSVVLLASVLIAAEIDPKLLPLIAPESKAIYGVDVDRYRSSALSKLFPLWLEGGVPATIVTELSQLIVTQGDDRDARLTILRGSLSQFEPAPDTGARVAVLDAATRIFGDEISVPAALERWRERENRDTDLAAGIRRLSTTYDNWFLIVRPL
jgi:hypothetical protein